MPGGFPDHPAPVVRNVGADRELVMNRHVERLFDSFTEKVPLGKAEAGAGSVKPVHKNPAGVNRREVSQAKRGVSYEARDFGNVATAS
jgi:hypothetical protein